MLLLYQNSTKKTRRAPFHLQQKNGSLFVKAADTDADKAARPFAIWVVFACCGAKQKIINKPRDSLMMIANSPRSRPLAVPSYSFGARSAASA
ncbi:MAG: hypothetical protein IKN72_00925 [Clostridia bacterium]|nr:hypothetical protein [Clostridia bacterium]